MYQDLCKRRTSHDTEHVMKGSKPNCLYLKVQNVATNKTMSLFLSCAQTFLFSLFFWSRGRNP